MENLQWCRDLEKSVERGADEKEGKGRKVGDKGAILKVSHKECSGYEMARKPLSERKSLKKHMNGQGSGRVVQCIVPVRRTKSIGGLYTRERKRQSSI